MLAVGNKLCFKKYFFLSFYFLKKRISHWLKGKKKQIKLEIVSIQYEQIM